MKEAEVRPLDLYNRYLDLAKRDAKTLIAERSDFVEVACSACAARPHVEAFEKLGFRWVVCRTCESLYISPRPTPEQLLNFYKNGESVKFWSSDFFRQTAEARREKMFQPRARLVAELVNREAWTGDKTFVDVGSGYGIFLEEIRKLGVFNDIVGVEPGPTMAQICRERGFRIVPKMAEDVVDGDCRADVATAFEVLEHVFDPLRFLAGVRRLLKPGGLFLYTTLTASGFDIQVLWERSNSAHPPHHLNLISVKGMELLLERAGFRLVELATPGELDLDIVANMVRENPALPLPRFVAEMLKSCDDKGRREFQSFLRNNRLSSHIRVVARA